MNSYLQKKQASAIRGASTQACYTKCAQALRELRPHYSSNEEILKQINAQVTHGYKLVYINGNEDDAASACAGYRLIHTLAWGKVLYIDDLIVDKRLRRKGLGSQLLSFLIEEARDNGCDAVHLDSGHHRHEAHKAYLKLGFHISCHHFEMNL